MVIGSVAVGVAGKDGGGGHVIFDRLFEALSYSLCSVLH